MEEISLKNVKEKFANARTSCPGMSEEIYALTDYITEVSGNDEIVPEGLTMIMALVMDDLINNRCGFAFREGRLPEYLESHNQQALAQLPYIIQVVDAIADKDFAVSFRKCCKEVLGFDVPIRVPLVSTKYPKYVVAAIEWWAYAIQAPSLNNGVNNAQLTALKMALTSSRRQFTAEEIKDFIEELAKIILMDLDLYGHCELDVDYSAYGSLDIATRKLKIPKGDISTFPWKTNMTITTEAVIVTVMGDSTTIWSKKNEIGADEHSAHKI